jgi:hypothetical protein
VSIAKIAAIANENAMPPVRVNIVMYATDIFETPENDLAKVRYAQRAGQTFSQWLDKANARTPLKDMGLLHVNTAKGDELWLVKATDVGLLYQDLYLGFGWRPETKTDAYVTTATIDGRRYILLIMMLHENPRDQINLGYKLDWAQFTHEFTHVMDYRRGYMNHKANMDKSNKPPNKDRMRYYNSPVEFNGYYQQGLHEILYALTILAMSKKDPDRFKTVSYQQFRTIYNIWFERPWLSNLNPIYKRKFNRRFYKFYRLVQTTFPDMEAINDIIKQNAKSA